VSTNFTFAPQRPADGLPDPATYPDLYDGVLWRRALAYLIDLVCIALIMLAAIVPFAILTVMSLGLLAPGLWFSFGLIPLAYHTLLVSSPWSATLGMRAFDIQLRSWDGARPIFLQALAHAALFYLTVVPTSFLILLVALFNRRKRTVHDMLTGMLMVRGPARD
jgi:uncharacterized RDD family membrane protein YckC